MDILDDMGVSKLSANVFSKVNYSFKMRSVHVGITIIIIFRLVLSFHILTELVFIT